MKQVIGAIIEDRVLEGLSGGLSGNGWQQCTHEFHHPPTWSILDVGSAASESHPKIPRRGAQCGLTANQS